MTQTHLRSGSNPNLPENHPYRHAKNLLATPHIGYVSRGLYERFYRDTVTNISTWLDEEHLGHGILNP